MVKELHILILTCSEIIKININKLNLANCLPLKALLVTLIIRTKEVSPSGLVPLIIRKICVAK